MQKVSDCFKIRHSYRHNHGVDSIKNWNGMLISRGNIHETKNSFLEDQKLVEKKIGSVTSYTYPISKVR